MNIFMQPMIDELKKDNGGHICYMYDNPTKYIETVVAFIVLGITHGEQVFLIENDRNMLHINKKLDKQLSSEQRNNLHFMNSFDFYWANGDFHPHTISHYFSRKIASFITNGVPIRTWGHVEWGDPEGIGNKLEEFEKIADQLVNKQGIISVCAYDANLTPATWKLLLINSHGVTLTDGEIIYSTCP